MWKDDNCILIKDKLVYNSNANFSLIFQKNILKSLVKILFYVNRFLKYKDISHYD